MSTAFFQFVHDLVHQVGGLDYPHAHWWMAFIATLVFVVAPAWTIWHLARFAARNRRAVQQGRARLWAALGRTPAAPARAEQVHPGTSQTSSRRHHPAVADRAGAFSIVGDHWPLETYVLHATGRFQIRLVLLSLLTLPPAWLLLEVPKHIINHALAGGDEHGGMTFLGFHLSRMELLFALCASYLAVLTTSGLIKYAANRARGRVNERLVRRLRLQIARRAHREQAPEHRSTLAAVAVQEIEPIGFFGGSLAVVPLIQGGTLATSILFLFVQNAALALAALIMLPVQLTLLPRLQRRLNAKVRERVYATRTLSALLTTAATHEGTAATPAGGCSEAPAPTLLRQQMRQAEMLERVRIEINDLKGRLKGVYNYTSNLTPFFFFAIGGYLVVQERLSLGALVAALAAYREIAPALRELFDFAQNWSDARARFEEVTKVLGRES